MKEAHEHEEGISPPRAGHSSGQEEDEEDEKLSEEDLKSMDENGDTDRKGSI